MVAFDRQHVLGCELRIDEHFAVGGATEALGVGVAGSSSGLEAANVQPGIPDWSTWSGDPFYDLYSHAEPGTVGIYSSAGFWRLGQALTCVWNDDLKNIIQERLFDLIGIPAERWDWLTGGYIKDQKYFYPTIPDSYTYLDPPYEINGNTVRSGPGWVVMSASDLARFGHLNATGGIWKGERVIDPDWLRGHSGGNKSGTSGESRYFTAMGVVTTEGFEYRHATETRSFLPEELFIGPVQVNKNS